MRTTAARVTLSAACLVLFGATYVVAQEKAQEKAQDKPSTIAPIVALDECDPITFNAALGPDFCKNVALGALGFATTLQDLFAKAGAGTPDPGWDFEPDILRIKQGTTLEVTDQGGEPHTFTEVKTFGGGFIEGLNAGEKTYPNAWVASRMSKLPKRESFKAATPMSRICQKASTCFSAAFIPGCA
jgi:plastocyanin